MRIQWDPGRDPALEPLPWRSLQVGLGAAVVPAYVERWTVAIEDVTPRVRRLRDLEPRYRTDLPVERPYSLPAEILPLVGATEDRR